MRGHSNVRIHLCTLIKEICIKQFSLVCTGHVEDDNFFHKTQLKYKQLCVLRLTDGSHRVLFPCPCPGSVVHVKFTLCKYYMV